jgi:hypothetical protein
MPDYAARKKKIDELAERARDVLTIDPRIKKPAAEGYGERAGDQTGAAAIALATHVTNPA